MDIDVAVIGAGVVGSATALELGRRGVSVALLEAEAEPGLAASGTNSGVLHTGFDSKPGELETELILRAAELRGPVLEELGVPMIRCGAVLRPLDDSQRAATEALAQNAAANGVEAKLGGDGALEVPGESVTDPVALTLGLAAAARAHGAELRTGFRVSAIERDGEGLTIAAGGGGAGEATREGDPVRCAVAVNCAGLGADEVAHAAGDDSFEIYPRKGEFLVFDPPGGEPLERVLLPVPEEGTKGVLVFPTIDGKLIAGPTAHDGDDKADWAVRASAREEILPKAIAIHPPLEGAEPIAAYAGLRPAGRGVNYVIGISGACERLVNVAAIRSTGMTASLAIAERAAELVADAGVEVGEAEPLRRGKVEPQAGPWWRRTAAYREPASVAGSAQGGAEGIGEKLRGLRNKSPEAETSA